MHVSQVVEELFTYWNLDSTDEACEELEEALIVSDLCSKRSTDCGTTCHNMPALCSVEHAAWSREQASTPLLPLQAADFGPRTALKVVDGVRDEIMGGKLKTGDAIRAELKVGCRRRAHPFAPAMFPAPSPLVGL